MFSAGECSAGKAGGGEPSTGGFHEVDGVLLVWFGLNWVYVHRPDLHSKPSLEQMRAHEEHALGHPTTQLFDRFPYAPAGAVKRVPDEAFAIEGWQPGDLLVIGAQNQRLGRHAAKTLRGLNPFTIPIDTHDYHDALAGTQGGLRHPFDSHRPARNHTHRCGYTQ